MNIFSVSSGSWMLSVISAERPSDGLIPQAACNLGENTHRKLVCKQESNIWQRSGTDLNAIEILLTERLCPAWADSCF